MPSTRQSARLTQLEHAGVSFHIYRDDLNHPTVSGNKLHKLSPNISLAKEEGFSGIASFGGPFSNHLHALAFACKQSGLNSIGLLRGELPKTLSPTLQDCIDWGMQLIPLPRSLFREFCNQFEAQESALQTANQLSVPGHNLGNDTLLIPEGGSNRLAVDSLAEAYVPIFNLPSLAHVTHTACATGTGATLAGLRQAAPAHINVVGIQAVAEGDATLDRINHWIDTTSRRLSIEPGHLGGFAKMPTELLTFINDFESTYDIPLDPVYNGKVMFKLFQLAEQSFFEPNAQVLVIHTGGVQGKRPAV